MENLSFMKTPFANDNGTGMHTNMSIWEEIARDFLAKNMQVIKKAPYT
ncbi:MAG: hypothetical protein CM15mP98_02260 [Paracoccaceae bacterium]|nr:MAG: hypothetical protein CM15mP98_02260 [Paracoccaceae bacterium]